MLQKTVCERPKTSWTEANKTTEGNPSALKKDTLSPTPQLDSNKTAALSPRVPSPDDVPSWALSILKGQQVLAERIEEQNSKNPSLLVQRAASHLRNSFQFKLYLALQLVAVMIGYGQAMLIVGLLWAMIVNTGKRREGEMSAYSLFNEDVQA